MTDIGFQNEDVQLYTDSAGGIGLGFGAYFAGKWTCGAWPLYWFDLGITEDITVLELFPILVSLSGAMTCAPRRSCSGWTIWQLCI